jgi:beta-N-acetylhexosaminidase
MLTRLRRSKPWRNRPSACAGPWLLIVALLTFSFIPPQVAAGAPHLGVRAATARTANGAPLQAATPAPSPAADAPAAPITATTAAPAAADPVAALLARMTPEQKIGQLFLTTFGGSSAAADTDIGKLIRNQHIGGVILSSVNQNFINNADTPHQIATLADELQTGALADDTGIPLFVALDHEGDGYPYQRVTGGLTPLPNPMALGATWNLDYAAAVGQITGRELAAMGFNLLLGPDVDVLNNPRPAGRGDMGTRTFGGDPWWVAQMGRAYICGVHQGGAGRIGTVAKHFPGHGGSDRLPDWEIATVDKSLSELKRIELPPFFAVTQAANPDDCAVTDAMMTSHIRYRGLQGNIRQFTAPISFDSEGLNSILGLPEFAGWRPGGMIVSDALGVPAVAKYFDPTEQTFPHRQIAKEALMAGNDLLSIDQFARPQAAISQAANLADTVAFFREEYANNPQFRQRVEDAAAHILRVKFKLYGGVFKPENMTVQPDTAAAAVAQSTGQGTATVNKIAHDAVTLLSPQSGTLPAAPRRGEDILIFTDAERVKDCRDVACEWYEALPVNAVQDAILRLYGPQGSGQVDPAHIHSASFADLKTYLAHLLEAGQTVTSTAPAAATPVPGAPPPPDVAALLAQAKWVIFAMRNTDRDANADAVRIFLDNGDGRMNETKLVVLAFNAPYYLDTTEISKLTLYLAAYSKTSPFVEAAVRALFGEYTPHGHPPVNVEGISYDLLRELAPDPARPFTLTQLSPEPTGETAPLAPLDVRVQAGPLIDRNGNRVPDGTEVIFAANYESSGGYVPAAHAMTTNGMAEAAFALRQPGQVVITARSGDAAQSHELRLIVAAPPTATASPSPIASPTLQPTPSATAAPTATPTPAPTPAPTPTHDAAAGPGDGNGQTATPGANDQSSAGRRALRLLLALAGIGLAGLLSFRVLGLRAAGAARRLRCALLCLNGGIVGYLIYLLLLPVGWQSPVAALLFGFAGAAVASWSAEALLLPRLRAANKRMA